MVCVGCGSERVGRQVENGRFTSRHLAQLSRRIQAFQVELQEELSIRRY